MFDFSVYSIMGPASLEDATNFRRIEIPSFPSLDEILNRDKEVKAYKFNNDIPYSTLSWEVSLRLTRDYMMPDCVKRLEDVLNSKIKVLIYKGQNDLIMCNPCV